MDLGEVVFARHRVLERIATSLTDALSAERALPSAALDRDLRFHETNNVGRGPQDLPRHAAELAGEDLAQRLHLLIRGSRIHDEGDLAVPLVDRLRPGINAGALHAGEIHVTTLAAADVEPDQGATAAVLGIREPPEVA